MATGLLLCAENPRRGSTIVRVAMQHPEMLVQQLIDDAMTTLQTVKQLG